MAPEEQPPDDALAGFLVRRFAPGADAPPSGSCPDANLLAAAQRGTLLAEERQQVEAHLRACGRCRQVFAAVAGAAEPGPTERAAGPGPTPLTGAPPSRRRGPRLPPWTLAAAALVAAGLALQGPRLWRWVVGPAGGGSAQVDRLLAAAAGDLARAHPDLFADFAPLDREELQAGTPVLRSPAPPAPGSGLVLLQPAGRILATRPDFRWHAAGGIEDAWISVFTATGEPLWRARCGAAPFPYPAGEPSLSPGVKYGWQLAGAGPAGAVEARGSFAVATVEEAAEFARAARAISATADSRIGDLLRAHFALRLGLIGEAEQAARAYAAAAPGEPIGRATLGFALRLLGSPEAAAFAPDAPSGDRPGAR